MMDVCPWGLTVLTCKIMLASFVRIPLAVKYTKKRDRLKRTDVSRPDRGGGIVRCDLNKGLQRDIS